MYFLSPIQCAIWPTRRVVCGEQAGEEETVATEDLESANATIVYLEKFHQFELLDSVFTQFLETNTYRGAHYSLTKLLDVKFPRVFQFRHLSFPYVSTVFTVDGYDTDWVNIKLCNDGFVYIEKKGVRVQRHMSKDWVALPEDMQYMQYIPGLCAAVKPLYSSMRAFYNYGQKRFDIKLYPQDAHTPHLIVTFEPGYPDGDDVVPLHAVPA